MSRDLDVVCVCGKTLGEHLAKMKMCPDRAGYFKKAKSQPKKKKEPPKC